jgi:multidrug efflux system membrane fusion protein
MVKNDQAIVEGAKLNLVYARVTAPISGRVGLRLVDPGNIIHAEDSLPSLMGKVRAGTKLTALAYNRDKSQLLSTGSLLTVDNQIDPQTGTLKLKAVFNNDENVLFPNQFVNVRLLLETRHAQVIVPSAAIQNGTQGTFVYVVKPDATVEARPIKVDLVENGDTSLASGLAAGEAVVVDGAENIQPGSHVRTDASESPSAGAKGPARGPGKGKKGA